MRDTAEKKHRLFPFQHVSLAAKYNNKKKKDHNIYLFIIAIAVSQ